MNKKLALVLLTGIVILAGVLRLWQLGNVPLSLDWDEVALGYDAYSIISTGKDEYGKFLPVVLRSFDDYKPALYAYLAIPSVLAFGLNEFGVRFSSAVFGMIAVLATYFLVKELFSTYSKFEIGNLKLEIIALLSALFIAISPWSIQFSRVAFEANVGAVLNILAALFFVKGLKKPQLLLLSAFFAGLNIYSYQREKVFTPLLILTLFVIYHKELFKLSKKYILLAAILGFLVVSPMVLYIFNNSQALLRVTGTSIFSYQTVFLKTNITKIEKDSANNDKLGLILDNRRLVYAKAIISGYISHFDPNWLFVTGDISRHHAPGMGILYLFEFPFILFGIYMLLFGKFDPKTKLVVFLWFLLAPLPASITTEVPHAVRTLNFLPTWQIFSALGIIFAVQKISNIKYKISKIHIKYLIFLLCFLFFIFNFSYYLNQYFVQLNYYDSQDWQYGYKQTIDQVKALESKYKEVIISDKQPMDKSYMFFLFYLKYPPSEYQKIGEKSSGGYAVHHSFGKYTFRPIDWQKDSLKKGVLYIGNPDEIPLGVSMKTIYNLNGTPAIRIAGT
ncbi:MAG: glycosyltransferase family 39 protein [Patescibacteria group bacterium]